MHLAEACDVRQISLGRLGRATIAREVDSEAGRAQGNIAFGNGKTVNNYAHEIYFCVDFMPKQHIFYQFSENILN